MAGGIALIFFAAASLFPYELVHCFSDSEAIVAEGVKYLNTVKYTYLLFALTNVTLAMLRSVETVKIAFGVSVSTFCINCGINYLLINGNFGFPRLGVTGAAIGTLCARAVELCIVLVYVFCFDRKLGAKLKNLFKADKLLMGDYFKHCKFFLIVAMLFGTSTALQTVILGHLTDAAIAANAASNSLFQILKVASIGASASAARHDRQSHCHGRPKDHPKLHTDLADHFSLYRPLYQHGAFLPAYTGIKPIRQSFAGGA